MQDFIARGLILCLRPRLCAHEFVTSDCKQQSVSRSSTIYDVFKENIPMATIMLHVDDTLDEEKVSMTFDELEV